MKLVFRIVDKLITMFDQRLRCMKLRVLRHVVQYSQKHGVKLHDRRSTEQVLKDLREARRKKINRL
jgi:hypothetical protein